MRIKKAAWTGVPKKYRAEILSMQNTYLRRRPQKKYRFQIISAHGVIFTRTHGGGGAGGRSGVKPAWRGPAREGACGDIIASGYPLRGMAHAGQQAAAGDWETGFSGELTGVEPVA